MNKLRKVIIKNVEFEVSPEGKIYKEGIELKQNINHDGYKVVYTSDGRSTGVHRMVAMAYVENDDLTTKVEVNHKDFDRTNNNYYNLEWLTHADNVKYSWENGRYSHIEKTGEKNPNYGNDTLKKKYRDNPELALEKQSRKGSINGKSKSISLFKDGELIKTFEYIGECCEYLHLNHEFSSNYETTRCGIRRSISKKRAYKGFTFKK